MKKSKTCTIEEATEWFKNKLPNTYALYTKELAPWEKNRLHFNGCPRPDSTHRRVYKPGRKIRSMDALSRWLDAGGWVFWGDKRRAFHPGWFRSLQFNVVLQSVQAGLVRKAVRI